MRKCVFPIHLLLYLLMGLLLCYEIMSFTEYTETRVGICYDVWYRGQENDSSWNKTLIVDIPYLGYYNSCDVGVIQQHLTWFKELDLDFAFMPWDGENSFTDAAIRVVFETAKEFEFNRTKFAICVQPYNETENGYNYTRIYDYVYDTFVSAHPKIYYYHLGKPLILFFNAPYLTPNGNYSKDPRFTVITFGISEYADWLYENFSPNFRGSSLGNRSFPVIPRFDETNFNVSERPGQYRRDANFTEGLYDELWEKAIECAKFYEIDVITIQCWNEYAERSNIEPHYDATADVDPFFLYNKTKNYICQLRGLEKIRQENWRIPRTLVFVVTTMIGGVVLVFTYSLRKNGLD